MTAYVSVDIFGGLGNQMFQYAAGKALALNLDAELRLCLELLENDAARCYSLDIFPNITEALLRPPEPEAGLLDAFLPAKRREKNLRRRAQAWRKSGNVAKEPHFHYWDGFKALRPGAHLQGYWQSPKYFSSCVRAIRRSFAFREFVGDADLAMERRMLGGNSVSVHVRRGDYTDPAVLAVHGLCGAPYYASAVSLMEKLLPDCTFFVFSDDPGAARELFHDSTDAVFLEGGTAERDMHLMQCCKHHIIANSSFSWWGAWLGEAEGFVVAPRNWFARETMINRFVLDLFPEDWILL